MVYHMVLYIHKEVRKADEKKTQKKLYRLQRSSGQSNRRANKRNCLNSI